MESNSGEVLTKYINQIDKFINRAYRKGYIREKVNFREIIMDRDRELWNKIINNENALQELLPNKTNRPLRQRGHEFELHLVRENKASSIRFSNPRKWFKCIYSLCGAEKQPSIFYTNTYNAKGIRVNGE